MVKQPLYAILFFAFGTVQLLHPTTTVEHQSKVALISGGAGFLGSNLAQRLLHDGYSVIAVDMLLTGSEENIAHLRDNPKFTFIKHDIIEPLEIKQPIDVIFNLASAASPDKYQSDPIHTTKTNVIGLLNMLDLARKHDAVILQASTSEIYGEPLIHPQIEEYWGNVNPIGIRSCYDEAKRCGESLCFDYHRVYETKIKVIRIFNTYGPGMDKDDGRVVSNFICQALQNQPITIYGNGSQTRSFCYVDDLIEGMLAIVNSDDSITGPINLGNPQEFSMKELAQKIIALTGSSSIISSKRLPENDPTRRKPDITKAQKLLHWQPKVNIEDGLKKTIEYFKCKI